jgi:hypothetical protein
VSVESNGSDRSHSDQCAGGWLKSPPGERLVLAGGLSRPSKMLQMSGTWNNL